MVQRVVEDDLGPVRVGRAGLERGHARAVAARLVGVAVAVVAVAVAVVVGVAVRWSRWRVGGGRRVGVATAAVRSVAARIVTLLVAGSTRLLTVLVLVSAKL